MQHVKTDIIHRVDLTDADVMVILSALKVAAYEADLSEKNPDGMMNQLCKEAGVYEPGYLGKVTERWRQLESIQRKGREGRIAGKGAQ